MTLTPMPWRDYKSGKAALADFNNNKDFIIADVMHPYSGKPANKEDLANERNIIIRYNQLRKTVAVK